MTNKELIEKINSWNLDDDFDIEERREVVKHLEQSSNSDKTICPCCGEPWDIKNCNTCQCGAFIKKRI
jgi:hypothetical protein